MIPGNIFQQTWRLIKQRFFALYAILVSLAVIYLSTASLGDGKIVTAIIDTVLLSLIPLVFLLNYHQLGNIARGTKVPIRLSLLVACRQYGRFLISKIVIVLPLTIAIVLGSVFYVMHFFPKVISILTRHPELLAMVSNNILGIVVLLLLLLMVGWGIYLSVRSALCGPIATMENLSIYQIIRRAGVLTRHQWWWAAFIESLPTLSFLTAKGILAYCVFLLTALLPMKVLLIKSLADHIYLLFIMPFLQLWGTGLIVALWDSLTCASRK